MRNWPPALSSRAACRSRHRCCRQQEEEDNSSSACNSSRHARARPRAFLPRSSPWLMATLHAPSSSSKLRARAVHALSIDESCACTRTRPATDLSHSYENERPKRSWRAVGGRRGVIEGARARTPPPPPLLLPPPPPTDRSDGRRRRVKTAINTSAAAVALKRKSARVCVRAKKTSGDKNGEPSGCALSRLEQAKATAAARHGGRHYG